MGGICMEIEAGELKQKIDRGDDVYILDVRTPQEYHGMEDLLQ